MKKGALLFLCLFPILCCAYFWMRGASQGAPTPNRQHLKDKYGSYFCPISVSKFTPTGIPCLTIQIENLAASAILDLGFRGQFSFSSQFIKQLNDKKYIGHEKLYRMRGGEYEETIYEIPLAEIGPVSFFDSRLHEHSEKSRNEATILQNGKSASAFEPCILGWMLFEITNLLLDLGESEVAYCDSMATLKIEGYPVEEFTRVPLLLERGLVECEAILEGKPLRFMLDTGSTLNFLNKELQNGKTIEDVIFGPENVVTCESFEVGKKNFGPILFKPIPIKLPIRIDAILGMEFFNTHLVFLDFSEKQAYFYKKPQNLL